MKSSPNPTSRPFVPVASELEGQPTRGDHAPQFADLPWGAGVPEKGRRISSLTPVIASIGALLMGSVLSLAAILNAVAQPVLAALLLILAAAHLLVGVVLKIRLKSVSFDGHRYRITGFFRTEEITPSEVCLVVEARGALWNNIRLHFNRPTCFGYDIAFVPAASRRDLSGLVAALRAGRDPDHARTVPVSKS